MAASVTLSEQDILYMPSHWSKRLHSSTIVPAHYDLLRRESEAAIARLSPEVFHYGESETNELLYYWFSPSAAASSSSSSSSLLIFIHGGYWQAPELTARMNCHMAASFAEAGGLHFASLGYDCAPRVTIEAATRLVEAGLRACLERARDLRLTGGVYVAGHSAGGHLAVAAGACVRWPPELASLIKGFVPISGVFDLMPLLKTSINDALGMNTARAAALSPLRGLRQQLLGDFGDPAGAGVPPIRAVVGSLESPEFHRQSRELCDLLREHGRPADLTVVPERDHFDIIERLADPGDQVVRLILDFVRSGGTLVGNSE